MFSITLLWLLWSYNAGGSSMLNYSMSSSSTLCPAHAITVLPARGNIYHLLSRQAEEYSLPTETFCSSFGNSITHLLGCVPFGSETELLLDLRLPSARVLAFTFRFRLISAAVGTFNISSRDCGGGTRFMRFSSAFGEVAL